MEWREYYVSFFWKHAGLISFGGPQGYMGWNVHLIPKYGYWHWGYYEDYYDGPLPQWGLGPLVLLCWSA